MAYNKIQTRALKEKIFGDNQQRNNTPEKNGQFRMSFAS